MDLVALSNGLHGSVQMDSVALFSWIGWLRHHGIFINRNLNIFTSFFDIIQCILRIKKDTRRYLSVNQPYHHNYHFHNSYHLDCSSLNHHSLNHNYYYNHCCYHNYNHNCCRSYNRNHYYYYLMKIHYY